MASRGWFIYKDGKMLGPYSREDLEEQIKEEKLNSFDLVWNKDIGDWVPAQEVDGLFAAPPPPPPDKDAPVTPPPPPTPSAVTAAGSRQSTAQDDPPAGAAAARKPSQWGRKLVIFVGFIVLLGFLTGAGWWGMSFFLSGPEDKRREPGQDPAAATAQDQEVASDPQPAAPADLPPPPRNGLAAGAIAELDEFMVEEILTWFLEHRLNGERDFTVVAGYMLDLEEGDPEELSVFYGTDNVYVYSFDQADDRGEVLVENPLAVGEDVFTLFLEWLAPFETWWATAYMDTVDAARMPVGEVADLTDDFLHGPFDITYSQFYSEAVNEQVAELLSDYLAQELGGDPFYLLSQDDALAYSTEQFHEVFENTKPVFIYNFVKTENTLKAAVLDPYGENGIDIGLLAERENGAWVLSEIIEDGF